MIDNNNKKCPEFHCTGILDKIRKVNRGYMRGFKQGGHKKLEIAEMRPI